MQEVWCKNKRTSSEKYHVEKKNRSMENPVLQKGQCEWYYVHQKGPMDWLMNNQVLKLQPPKTPGRNRRNVEISGVFKIIIFLSFFGSNFLFSNNGPN